MFIRSTFFVVASLLVPYLISCSNSSFSTKVLEDVPMSVWNTSSWSTVTSLPESFYDLSFDPGINASFVWAVTEDSTISEIKINFIELEVEYMFGNLRGSLAERLVRSSPAAFPGSVTLSKEGGRQIFGETNDIHADSQFKRIYFSLGDEVTPSVEFVFKDGTKREIDRPLTAVFEIPNQDSLKNFKGRFTFSNFFFTDLIRDYEACLAEPDCEFALERNAGTITPDAAKAE